MKNQNLRHLFELNLTMILMSTSGPLGRMVHLSPPLAIWCRCFIAVLALWAFCRWRRIDLRVNWSKDGFMIILGGILQGLHWVSYFYALQLSNVAIGMLSLFTYPVLTTLLEPILLKTKFRTSHICFGILVIIGIYLLAPEFSLENNDTKGILFGLLSAVMYAFRNILLKKKVNRYHGSALLFFQLIIIVALFSPVLLLFDVSSIAANWLPLVALGLFTTAMGHTFFVMSFKHFSVSTASIISSSQPIYGIVAGMLFLNEFPHWSTITGGALIVFTVVIESIRSYRIMKKSPESLTVQKG